MSTKNIQATSIKNFQDIVWEYFAHNRREMPWRHPDKDGSYDPYKVMVSELMLQQTQVMRVIPKYEMFIKLFPNVQALAAAELGDVLKTWNGLGYNRRAKFLWSAAQHIVTKYDGVVPDNQKELVSLPGIGVNTAAAILAYAHNRPVVFIETNIRTAIIHHFFNDEANISDREIEDIVTKVLPKKDYRLWYYALMDYGSYLKASIGNKSRQAKSYTKQSTFRGSTRQIRGQVLRLLIQKPYNIPELNTVIADDRLPAICQQLLADGLIHQNKGIYSLG